MSYKVWGGIFLASFTIAAVFLFGSVLGKNSAYKNLEGRNVLGEKNQSANKNCTTIQEEKLNYSLGHYLEETPLTTGYDEYGYNYQAHQFRGSYANVYLGRDGFPPYKGDSSGYLNQYPEAENTWYWPYRDDYLLMKWNDTWIANSDCDDDGLLDRHYGLDSYIGSGAWETNHQSGTYEMDGKTCKWNYFVKISAMPEDAVLKDGVWYTSNGAEIGPVIWGQFAVTQEVYNDPCGGYGGVQYLSPAGPGFGKWK